MVQKHKMKEYKIDDYDFGGTDFIAESQIPMYFESSYVDDQKDLNVLSLFSGCGGMDLGFEGNFITNSKSINPTSGFIQEHISSELVRVEKTRFKTVFANDILKEAKVAWTNYMRRFGYEASIYRTESIVDLVKMHRAGAKIFPDGIDVVTGGFPCQDFSVAGKRKGFDSDTSHNGGKRISTDTPKEESRGQLYHWMKEVVEITQPKIFIAENVKGLISLGDAKDIIQRDFSLAGGAGYIVLEPKVLHAGNYGVPESRERVIFIGIRRDALRPDALAALEMKNVPEEYNPYPKPTHACTIEGDGLSQFVKLKDVFAGLKEPNESTDLSQIYYSGAKFMGTHCQGQSEVDLEKIGPTIRSEHHGNIEYRRLSVEHGGKHIGELQAGLKERRLTPRECALIQTFPHDYPFVIKQKDKQRFLLSSSGAYKVIGNAVPPVLAYNIAMRIQSIWNRLFN